MLFHYQSHTNQVWYGIFLLTLLEFLLFEISGLVTVIHYKFHCWYNFHSRWQECWYLFSWYSAVFVKKRHSASVKKNVRANLTYFTGNLHANCNGKPCKMFVWATGRPRCFRRIHSRVASLHHSGWCEDLAQNPCACIRTQCLLKTCSQSHMIEYWRI